MVKVASLRSDTDLNVSGSVIDDKHYPSMMNILFFIVRSQQAVICSSG